MQNAPWFQYPQFSWKQKHAAIIGGGLAGCQMAYHLCESGWHVTLIERHSKLSMEASGNPAGVISPKMTATPSLGEDFYTQAFHYTLKLLETLQQQGKKIDWQACGVLQLAHNKREEKRWKSLQKRQLANDFIQLLNADETEAMAGIKLHSSHPYKSSYFPKGGWINPASFATALASHPHCEIIAHTSAIKLTQKGNINPISDLKGQCIVHSEVVIIANGKDLFDFEQSSFLAGMPVAGQTTSTKASETSQKLKTVIGHEGYLTPAMANQHIFGATFERIISEPDLTEQTNSENQQCLSKYLPEFSASLTSIKSAHCAVRMTTPDRFPYVGALPKKDFYQDSYHDLHQGKHYKTYPPAQYQTGLFVLGGLGSRGIITSGLCAKALVDCINNEVITESSKDILQYTHPARFLIKSLKKQQAFAL